MNKKILTKIISTTILIALILLIKINSAQALGIMPSLKIIDYDTQEHTIDVNIINTEHTDKTIKIHAEGELTQYITIENDTIEMKNTDEGKTFTYKIKLPPEITPGTKTINIIATETKSNQGNTINSALSVTHKLQINVPYTGLYAEGFLSMSETATDTPTTFTASITNKGTETIKQATGHITINAPEGKTIYTSTEKTIQNIEPKTSKKIEETWTPNIQPGEYTINYIIQYDNKNMTLTKTFELGEYNIEIKNITTETYKIGTIAKININITNNWNNPITTQTNVIILDKNNAVVGETNVAPVSINSGGGTIDAYWDTKGINTGEYTVKVIVKYGSKTSEKDYYSSIGADSIRFSEEKTVAGKVGYIPIIIFIFLALAVIAFLVGRPKDKKRRNIR